MWKVATNKKHPSGITDENYGDEIKVVLSVLIIYAERETF